MTPTHLILLAQSHPEMPPAFIAWLRANEHIWFAFEKEALKIVAMGFSHYSARTIIHFLRHHSAITESETADFKINNDHSPYLGRLFALVHPKHAGLFAYRAVGVAA